MSAAARGVVAQKRRHMGSLGSSKLVQQFTASLHRHAGKYQPKHYELFNTSLVLISNRM